MFHSDVIIANTNEMYAEPVTGHGSKNDVQHCKDQDQKDQESLYYAATNGVAWNPVYDRFDFLKTFSKHNTYLY